MKNQTIQIEVSKDDMIRMIRGISPSYNLIENTKSKYINMELGLVEW